MGTTLTKDEWERKAKKGCIICGHKCGTKAILQKAHLRASSKGGTQIEAMCPTHHSKYDKGLCSDTELKKIGITRATYKRWVPKKKNVRRVEHPLRNWPAAWQ
jgi:flavoprotein